MRRLNLRIDLDSTGVRRPFDCLSKVIKVTERRNPLATVALTYLHYALAAAQCIVIGPVCGFVCLFVGLLPR